MHFDYLLVGAGLFSAVIAQKMREAGKSCIVVEKRGHVGGNIYTEKVGQINVHKYGAHIFHTSNEEVWAYVNRFAKFNHYVNSPVAIYKDELYNLPFNMNTFSKMWNIKTPKQAKEIIQKQQQESGITTPNNLEEHALKMVGKDVYEKLVKGYTEKQWGRDCRDLPAFIIKRLPLRFTFDNNYFTDPYQGIPIGGYTAMVEKMFGDTKIILGKDLKTFLKENETSKDPVTYEAMVYTGMIDEYFDYCYGQLEYRSLSFETQYLENEDNYQGNAVVNYTEREVPYTRIIEHKHFEFLDCPGTVITKEYPAVFSPGKEPYYPMNDEKNNTLYEKYKALAAESEKVYFGGRLGQYKYFDMDKVIASALEMAEMLLRQN